MIEDKPKKVPKTNAEYQATFRERRSAYIRRLEDERNLIEAAMSWYRATAGQLSRDDMAQTLDRINKILRGKDKGPDLGGAL